MIMMRRHNSSMSSRSCVVSKNCGAKFAIDGAEKLADMVLGHNVESDGGLVEKQQGRIMQQRRRQIAAHALAERELAHRRVQVVANVQESGRTVPCARRNRAGKHRKCGGEA